MKPPDNSGAAADKRHEGGTDANVSHRIHKDIKERKKVIVDWFQEGFSAASPPEVEDSAHSKNPERDVRWDAVPSNTQESEETSETLHASLSSWRGGEDSHSSDEPLGNHNLGRSISVFFERVLPEHFL